MECHLLRGKYHSICIKVTEGHDSEHIKLMCVFFESGFKDETKF